MLNLFTTSSLNTYSSLANSSSSCRFIILSCYVHSYVFVCCPLPNSRNIQTLHISLAFIPFCLHVKFITLSYSSYCSLLPTSTLLTWAFLFPFFYRLMPRTSHIRVEFVLPAVSLRSRRMHLTRGAEAAVLISASCKSLQDEENVADLYR